MGVSTFDKPSSVINDMISMDPESDVGVNVVVGYNIDVGSYVGPNNVILDILYEYEFGTMVNILFCVLDSWKKTLEQYDT
jgi:hypothetical protein